MRRLSLPHDSGSMTSALDGDLSPEARVAGAIHLAHPAAAQQREDFEAAEPAHGCSGHRLARYHTGFHG
jgi:hypothetical protein